MEDSSIRQIAFYGKGGIGKSTVVANVSSALNEMKHKVLQVGCDPKHDSSRPFWNGAQPRTIIDLLRDQRGSDPHPSEYVHTSESGVEYFEVGGPEPGVGCAGRGILKMFELLDEARLLDNGYDVVIYDVLGDVVCGGFAAPMRAGYAREVYVVVSGEFMSLYAANNICRGVAKYAERRKVRLGGFVLNCRQVPNEKEIVSAFAKRLGSRIVGEIPRDSIVSKAERMRRTVVEAFGESNQAHLYRTLAGNITGNQHFVIPQPANDDELEELYYREADQDASS